MGRVSNYIPLNHVELRIQCVNLFSYWSKLNGDGEIVWGRKWSQILTFASTLTLFLQLILSSLRSAKTRPVQFGTHGRLRPPSAYLPHTDGTVARCLERSIPVTLFLGRAGLIPTLCSWLRYFASIDSIFYLRPDRSLELPRRHWSSHM